MLLAQPALPPDEGLSRLVALLAAAGIAYAAIMLHQWWQERKIQNPSPPPPTSGGHDDDPQVGDGVTTDDTTAESGDDTTPWWRMGVERIELANGSTLVRKARAVWRTGSSELPEDEQPAAASDDEDDGLDEVGGESRADYTDRLLEQQIRTTDAAKAIMRTYEVSESTAMREIRAARQRLRQ